MQKLKLSLRSITCILMVIVLLLAPACKSSKKSDSDFKPVLRFAVAGDVHIRRASENMQSREQLEALISSAYAYSESHSDYKKLDGFFFTGDNADAGYEEELTDFFGILKNNLKGDTIARAVMGNHEYYATGGWENASMIQDAIDKYVRISGYESEDGHITIGGYHFIFLSTNMYDKVNVIHYTTEKLDWLKKELDAAVAADPNKHIFVFNHMPPANTMFGSHTTASDPNLTAVLAQYPQVVDFSGHTHCSMANPNIIWQDSFTALNTGSLAWIETWIDRPDGTAIKVTQTNKSGASAEGIIKEGPRSGGMYYIVEIDNKGIIRISIVDIFSQSVFGEPFILDTIDPDQFTYTADRKDKATEPKFKFGARAKVVSANHKNPLITFPQAVCEDVVQSYHIEIYHDDKLINTIDQLALTFYGGATPKRLETYLGTLEPSTKYTVKIYPVSSYAVLGKPLSFKFKTKASAPTTPDVLNVVFNSDGTAKDTVSGTLLKTHGAPTVSRDNDLRMNVATFDGKDDAYTFDTISNWYDVIKKSVTLDSYIYLEELPRFEKVSPISNQQAGGFGFEYNEEGEALFYCKLDTKTLSTITCVPVASGQWVRMTATFDGNAVKLYINGKLMDTATSSGAITPPAVGAQFLGIGADSAAYNMLSNFFKGKVASVSMYSYALTAEEIAALHTK